MKFNKYYLEFKENKLKKLEDLRIKITQEIQQEKKLNDDYKMQMDKVRAENEELKHFYNSLKDMLIGKGIIFDIENNNFTIKEWDSLYLEKKGNKFYMVTKKAEEVYGIDVETSDVIEELIKDGYICSLIVIRLINKTIKVQLRFNKKE